MPRCEACGAHVTPHFARVFGDNDDDIYRCLDCATATEVFEGESVEPKGTWNR
jgi:hypothetical protein